ncbi:hypothetical protein BD410DRAFT_721585 [Rickenella mellea]|uniref:RBR-type E3 ubiquitin transferase n=1 Tax=Rickenella mellea TaxID=50990 RepID=A0A4Y7Q7S7_9AGAM|nr:hypothetical protein BD410DRAFT_721585 [Rickenella mellea]
MHPEKDSKNGICSENGVGKSTNNADHLKILGGDVVVVSHPGLSQYTRGTPSSCGIAALNCVRLVLDLERNGVTEVNLLKAMMERRLMDDILSICADWSSDAHLELDEILSIPLFDASLRLLSSDYGRLGQEKFEEMLQKLNEFGQATVGKSIRSCAVIITRPPEIVTCLRISNNVQDVYVIFDSHPRPKHPDGGAFIFNVSVKGTAQHLAELFHFDERLLHPSSGVQWQVQLLANVSGHYFESTNHDFSDEAACLQAVFTASISMLAMKAAMNQLTSQNAYLASENKRQAEEITLMMQEQMEWKADRSQHKGKAPERHLAISSTRSSGNKPRNTTPVYDLEDERRPIIMSSLDWDGHQSNAVSYGREAASRQHGRKDPVTPGASSHTKGKKNAITRTFKSLGHSSASGKAFSSDLGESDASFLLANQMQSQFEEEDAQLRLQHNHLISNMQTTFDCGVCLETLPEDELAMIEMCKHPFCRQCLRQYAKTKVKEHLYPIICPTCKAQGDSKAQGNVTEILIHELGLSQKEYEIYIELSLTQFSTLVHCRKCKSSYFIDRKEYDEAEIISCPLRNCNYLWCKSCQQVLEIGGPKHSCDGSSELAHLMRRRGWKHCPGCQTPTEKITGCNHMTCFTPGCNTHFCYVCGKSIVKSSLRSEIQSAVSAHYRKCSLFEHVADRGVPP